MNWPVDVAEARGTFGAGKRCRVYRGFLIGTFEPNAEWVREFAPVGRQLLGEASSSVRRGLGSFLRDGGAIDGAAVQRDWFPDVEADVFLSHSHTDEDVALALAGWAWRKLNLRVFVDSAIWGNASDLLKEIDDKYCKNPEGNTYDYQKRNRSTSHVHMMLATALAMMIDKAECAWVLETKNSITARGAVGKTESPWLYSEIATMHHIRRRTRESYRQEKEKVAEALRKAATEPLKVIYDVPLGALTVLSVKDIIEWQAEYARLLPRRHALDVLYRRAPEMVVERF